MAEESGWIRDILPNAVYDRHFDAPQLVPSWEPVLLPGGDVSNPHRIRQTARVELQSPTDITELANPAIIEVQWGTSWTRWDGEPYTASGTFVEDEMMLRYVLMYSADNGSTYRYVQDGSIATPGALPTNGTYIISDTGSGDETYDWSVPSATFPEATYLLRVECYRAGAQSHYAWHTNRIFIQR